MHASAFSATKELLLVDTFVWQHQNVTVNTSWDEYMTKTEYIEDMRLRFCSLHAIAGNLCMDIVVRKIVVVEWCVEVIGDVFFVQAWTKLKM